MHAIQSYHHVRLQGYLIQLKHESEVFKLPDEHLNTVVQQEKKLIQVYNKYQAALEEVAILIKQYDKEHQSVRRLMFMHKRYRKLLQKK
jgi:predicted chitinase